MSRLNKVMREPAVSVAIVKTYLLNVRVSSRAVLPVVEHFGRDVDVGFGEVFLALLADHRP